MTKPSAVSACSKDNTETSPADDHSSAVSEVSDDISSGESSAENSTAEQSASDGTKPVVVMDAGLSAATKMSLEMKQDEELTAEDCTNVTTLSVSSPEIPIHTLDGIEYFVNLKELSVYGSDISDISPLNSLPELESISFSLDMIEEIPDLSGCKKLKSVSFIEDTISDISPLAKIENLESVFLLDNCIRSIAPLKDNHTIKYIFIDNNPVADWESIAENDTLKKALAYDLDYYLTIEKRAKEIISETITNEMSDLEKQVRLAEYIEDYMDYNLEAGEDDDGKPLCYYGIIEPIGYCKYYSITAKYLMCLAGLNVRTCYSVTHEWNMIELDGKWYEFDCTFDDDRQIENWKWFNKSRETMGLNDDHILENESFKPHADEDMPKSEYLIFE